MLPMPVCEQGCLMPDPVSHCTQVMYYAHRMVNGQHIDPAEAGTIFTTPYNTTGTTDNDKDKVGAQRLCCVVQMCSQ
jgi:hypothetical protein